MVRTTRSRQIELTYDTLVEGEWYEVTRKFKGFEAVKVQHELDHLNGWLIEDRGKEIYPMSDALFTNGCSFVVGHELKDLTRIDRFSNLVAKHFGWFDWNEGKVGAGNGRIMRTTINSILQNNVYYFRKERRPWSSRNI